MGACFSTGNAPAEHTTDTRHLPQQNSAPFDKTSLQCKSTSSITQHGSVFSTNQLDLSPTDLSVSTQIPPNCGQVSSPASISVADGRTLHRPPASSAKSQTPPAQPAAPALGLCPVAACTQPVQAPSTLSSWGSEDGFVRGGGAEVLRPPSTLPSSTPDTVAGLEDHQNEDDDSELPDSNPCIAGMLKQMGHLAHSTQGLRPILSTIHSQGLPSSCTDRLSAGPTTTAAAILSITMPVTSDHSFSGVSPLTVDMFHGQAPPEVAVGATHQEGGPCDCPWAPPLAPTTPSVSSITSATCCAASPSAAPLSPKVSLSTVLQAPSSLTVADLVRAARSHPMNVPRAASTSRLGSASHAQCDGPGIASTSAGCSSSDLIVSRPASRSRSTSAILGRTASGNYSDRGNCATCGTPSSRSHALPNLTDPQGHGPSLEQQAAVVSKVMGSIGMLGLRRTNSLSQSARGSSSWNMALGEATAAGKLRGFVSSASSGASGGGGSRSSSLAASNRAQGWTSASASAALSPTPPTSPNPRWPAGATSSSDLTSAAALATAAVAGLWSRSRRTSLVSLEPGSTGAPANGATRPLNAASAVPASPGKHLALCRTASLPSSAAATAALADANGRPAQAPGWGHAVPAGGGGQAPAGQPHPSSRALVNLLNNLVPTNPASACAGQAGGRGQARRAPDAPQGPGSGRSLTAAIGATSGSNGLGGNVAATANNVVGMTSMLLRGAGGTRPGAAAASQAVQAGAGGILFGRNSTGGPVMYAGLSSPRSLTHVRHAQ